MAVIDLGPSRWSRMGSNLGFGVSSGLMQALEEQRQREMKKRQVQQQARDLRGIMDAFQQARTQEGGQQGTLQSVLDQYQPQTEAGLNLFTDMLTNRQDPQQVTLSKVEDNGTIRQIEVTPDQAQRLIKEGGWRMGSTKGTPNQGKTDRVKVTAYKNGKKVPMMIPKSSYNDKIKKLRDQGYSFDEPDTGASGSGLSGRTKEINYWLKTLGMKPTKDNVQKITRDILNPMYGRGKNEYERQLYSKAIEAARDKMPIGGDWTTEQLMDEALSIYQGMVQGAPGMAQETGWQGPGYYADGQGGQVKITSPQQYQQFIGGQ